MAFKRIRLFFPIFLALFLLIISTAPVDVFGASAFFPAVDIMVIYFWASYRPSTMPYWFVFILGILRDSLDGIILGVNPFVYLLTRLIVVSAKGLYRKDSFILMWQGFAVVLIIAITLQWILASFLADRPIALDLFMIQFLVSIAIYPLLHRFFNLLNKAMPENFQDA